MARFMLGSVTPKAALTSESVTATAVAPANATAAYTVSSLGLERHSINGVITSHNEWRIDQLYGTNRYAVRGTLVSGAVDSGTFGVIEDCATSRTWTVQVTSDTGGSQQAVIDVEIFWDSTGVQNWVLQDTTRVTISAEVTV